MTYHFSYAIINKKGDTLDKKNTLIKKINSTIVKINDYCAHELYFYNASKEIYSAFYKKFYDNNSSKLKQILQSNSIINNLNEEHLTYFLKYLEDTFSQIKKILDKNSLKNYVIYDLATPIANSYRNEFLKIHKILPVTALKKDLIPDNKTLITKLNKYLTQAKYQKEDLDLKGLKLIKRNLRESIESFLKENNYPLNTYPNIVAYLYKGFYGMTYTQFEMRHQAYQEFTANSSYTDFMTEEQFILHNASLELILEYLQDCNSKDLDKINRIAYKIGDLTQEMLKTKTKEDNLSILLRELDKKARVPSITNLKVTKSAIKIYEKYHQISLFENEKGRSK